MIVSNTIFLWFCTAMVVGLAGIWFVWDAMLLRRLWKTRKENHDEFFGGLMGILIVIVAFTGVVLHHRGL